MNTSVYKSATGPVELISVHIPRHRHDNILTRVADSLRTWNARYQQRQRLLQLDERLLKDIGVSYEDVWAEVSKPFWR